MRVKIEGRPPDIAGGVSAAAGDVASGHGLDIEHIAAGAVAGGTYAAVFEATGGNAFAAGAASGAVSSAFSQSWNYIATGGASGFDLAQVGESALIGGATGWAANKAVQTLGPKLGSSGSRPVAEEPAAGQPASCNLSFTAATLVATTTGKTAISALRVGQLVEAYDLATGVTSPHRVSAVMTNLDPVVEHLSTDAASIDTTPNHPFFSADRGWVLAGSLRSGEKLRTQAGGSATVLGFTLAATPSTIWDLTVDGAHTFFVGSGAGVLVHNCGGESQAAANGRAIHNQFDQTLTTVGKDDPAFQPGVKSGPNRPDGFYNADPIELKPNNPSALSAGIGQLQRYMAAYQPTQSYLYTYDTEGTISLHSVVYPK